MSLLAEVTVPCTSLWHCIATLSSKCLGVFSLPLWTMSSYRAQIVPIVSEYSVLNEVIGTDEELNTW